MLDIESIKNTVIHGDCLEVMKQIPDGSVDLTVTSPPYDNLRTYNWFSWDFEWIAKELYRITKNWGVVVWVVGDATIKGSETGTSFRQALYFKDIWFNLHDTMIYQKEVCPFPDKNRYYQWFEYMFILSKWTPKTFNPIQDRINKSVWRIVSGTERNKDWTTKHKHCNWNIIKEKWTRFNYWLISDGKRQWLHPAVFPEKLAQDHILSRSNELDLIFDPFMWSWTTAVACINTKRNFIWIEISQEYIEIINKRLENITPSLF